MIGTTLRQRFYLDRELGRGGMGAVYRAIDRVLERPVAIKVLNELHGEEVGRRLRLEAQILARLLHENIVRLYDFDEENGTFFFIMEEVDGTSFYKRWRPISIPERLRILALVADALDYAHHQGIIHRDVKPGNILLTATDQPKLSDFGLSVVIDQEQETGIARGTPMYMSPEQARGRRLDHRSDLYALGVLLYESATSSLPFQGNPMAIMAQHINEEPEPPKLRNPEISEPLNRLILELLAKNPLVRPGSGAVVAQAIRDLIEGDRWNASSFDASEAAPTLDLGTLPPTQTIEAARDDDHARVGPEAELAATEPRPAASGAAIPSVHSRPSTRIGRVLAPSRRDADRLIDEVEAEPIALSPEQRYLSGHYLAYLLGGSRRRGILLRRPLDPLNADRGRLMLAMAWLMRGDATEADINRAARLLDERPDIRPRLSPIVVNKYLRSRDNPEKRKRFRRVRKALQQASTYANRQMLDRRGILNPGLMPQALDDLYKIAPERNEVDDELVARWNHLTDLWRSNADFRRSVLRYATLRAADDPASIELWPEVVYPLIERARWQRQIRTRAEDFWDVFAGRVLHVPIPGIRMDRVFSRELPRQEVDRLDDSLIEFRENPELLDELMDDTSASQASSASVRVRSRSLEEIAAEEPAPPKDFVPLAEPDPVRFTLGDLRNLWREAIASQRAADPQQRGHHLVPVGPYRLTVVASIRAHKAGTVAVQGMKNKQVEMLVPSFSGGGSNSRPILAVWIYQNRSLVIGHVDARGINRYILWDAATNQQSNYDDPADLNHHLLQLSMEAPDQLHRALTRRFRPRSTA